MDDLILFDDPLNSLIEQKSTSLDFKFFNRLDKLECFYKKRCSWYTEEQLQELSKLFYQYTERKKMIRSAWKYLNLHFANTKGNKNLKKVSKNSKVKIRKKELVYKRIKEVYRNIREASLKIVYYHRNLKIIRSSFSNDSKIIIGETICKAWAWICF